MTQRNNGTASPPGQVGIIDYRMGNVGSIANMIAKVGGSAIVTNDPEKLRAAAKLVLPGVGHFDRGMANLDELGLTPLLRELVVERRVPVLGICLGMQLLCRKSEEGERPGLGWIEGDVVRFESSARPGMKIPHMGWNVAKPVTESPLFSGAGDNGPDSAPTDEQRFYFVHSYYVACENPRDVLAVTNYEGEFCSALHHENIWGVQFHPEKSHAFGMNLFRRFLDL